MIDEPKTEIRAMSPKELAARYNVSVRTLKKWISPFMETIGPIAPYTKIYTPRQVAAIFKCIEAPE